MSEAAIATADRRASEAGAQTLAHGGSAVDAAIAANAVMAVVAPNLCGLGGDLFALVHHGGDVSALNASGRAGSGADAGQVRAEGHQSMPFRHDARSVTIPGCVDGWLALHARFGRLPLHDLLAPAIGLARSGSKMRQDLRVAIAGLDERGRSTLHDLAWQAIQQPERVVLSGVADAMTAVARDGRDGFYLGEFGAGLVALDRSDIRSSDLEHDLADWVEPLRAEAFGHVVHTIPPNSQGYLTLAGAAMASTLGLPDDDADPLWAHILIECASVVGCDRRERLSDKADGPDLLRDLARRASWVKMDGTFDRGVDGGLKGDTTYLCVIDGRGQGISLIQSNASGFGSWLVEPTTGINLQNRGVGFSLQAGHSAELGPGRRPPHTLAPVLVTEPTGRLAGVLGAAGGDGQPQTVLQLLARLYGVGSSARTAVNAPRWVLRRGEAGFDTWANEDQLRVLIEKHAPSSWFDALDGLGHVVESVAVHDGAVGHAHVIVTRPGGGVDAAADPRAENSAAFSFASGPDP